MNPAPLISAVAPIAAAAAATTVRAAGRVLAGGAFPQFLTGEPVQRPDDGAASPPPFQGLLSFRGMSAALRNLLESAGASLTHMLSAAGIDLSRPIDMSLGEDGRVSVDRRHPQAAAIEARLNADAGASSAIRQALSELQSAPFGGDHWSPNAAHSLAAAAAATSPPQLRLENGVVVPLRRMPAGQ